MLWGKTLKQYVLNESVAARIGSLHRKRFSTRGFGRARSFQRHRKIAGRVRNNTLERKIDFKAFDFQAVHDV